MSMRIDEFAGTPLTGTFSDADKIRFISVGFDIGVVVPPAIIIAVTRSLLLADKTRSMALRDSSFSLVLRDDARSLSLRDKETGLTLIDKLRSLKLL